jgi:hypothetical protein
MKISTVLQLATLGLSAIGCSALIPDSGGYVCTADLRPGVYSVEVKRPGYATFGVNDVRVDRDVCHVRTVRVQAALVAVP